MILRRLIRELRVTPRERTYVRRFQNAQDHHLGQNYTRDMHARRPFKTSHQRIMVARRDTRSRSCMRALQRIQSGCPVHPEPGHGSRTSAAHSMRIIEGQSRPNSPMGAANVNWPRGSPNAAHGSIHCPGYEVHPKRTAAARPDHPGRVAGRLSTRSPPGSPRPLERPPATPGGSRPSREASKSILRTVRRAGRPARRS